MVNELDGLLLDLLVVSLFSILSLEQLDRLLACKVVGLVSNSSVTHSPGFQLVLVTTMLKDDVLEQFELGLELLTIEVAEEDTIDRGEVVSARRAVFYTFLVTTSMSPRGKVSGALLALV